MQLAQILRPDFVQIAHICVNSNLVIVLVDLFNVGTFSSPRSGH